jgi:D-alanyl-lipoteichoic acid acyltransferase DltB (MBOAT superfamily)
MQFNSYSYLFLLSAAVSIFWLLPIPLRRWYVLALSVAFYASWTWTYAALPFFMCGVVFLCARKILTSPRHSRAAMWAGTIFVLSILAFFKYRHFLVDNISATLQLFGQSPVRSVFAVGLPLGISFYSFEAISYLIDVRQGRAKNVSFLDLWLFVTFWPHLIAGPIVRVRELVPQLGFKKQFDASMLIQGLDRLIWGLVQKNLIANNLAAWVEIGFLPQAANANTTTDNWFFAFAFGLQVYFDFAAYSNMAIGAASLIGISLPENFNFPYHARNAAEFWSRWHMTLSRWIRDYLFFPVSARFQHAPVTLGFSLVGTMALVGLWHGAGWTFVLWGVLHGVYLVLFRLWERVGRSFPALHASRISSAGLRLLTTLAVMAAWIPFRAATLNQALVMLRSLVVPNGLRPSYSINFYLITLLVVLFVMIEPILVSWLRMLERRVVFPANLLLLRPALYACGLLLFLIFDDRDTQFIYFQF